MMFIWTKMLICSMYAAFAFNTIAHPIYLSTTEVDYKEKTKTLEISVKIYADDLEAVLSAQKKEKVELGTDREHPKAKAYIVEYLQKHLHFFADEQALKYNYIGHEAGGRSDMFAMYVYLEIENVKQFKTLKVENSILIDAHANQLNFVACHTKSNGLLKVIAKKGETTQLVNW
jgi:hypothetical protein